MTIKVISLFSGCGGLDLGFKKAGFDIPWANEYDKTIWDTYRHNHKKTFLDTRSIVDISSEDIQDCDGIIGGPPCQSWSEAGAMRGINDARGELFFEFIRILFDKQPKFFLAENVSGMMSKRHQSAIQNIKLLFNKAGYNLYFKVLNAKYYQVPQDRKRIIFIGFRKDLALKYTFPIEQDNIITLRDTISTFKGAIPAGEKNRTNQKAKLSNEYMHGSFSSIYMSRNRVRSWDEPSFTIQAGGRHAPMHPSAPKMIYKKENKFIMSKGDESLYRRMSVRECAAIQTFPSNFIFKYDKVADGYKMVGNAVPVNLAYILAQSIKQTLKNTNELTASNQQIMCN